MEPKICKRCKKSFTSGGSTCQDCLAYIAEYQRKRRHGIPTISTSPTSYTINCSTCGVEFSFVHDGPRKPHRKDCDSCLHEYKVLNDKKYSSTEHGKSIRKSYKEYYKSNAKAADSDNM